MIEKNHVKSMEKKCRKLWLTFKIIRKDQRGTIYISTFFLRKTTFPKAVAEQNNSLRKIYTKYIEREILLNCTFAIFNQKL